MRWLLLFALLRPTANILAQEPATVGPAQPAPARPQPATPLPDSPGAVKTYHQIIAVTTPPVCKSGEPSTIITDTTVTPHLKTRSCTPASEFSPYQRFLNSPAPLPMTSRQKGLLAIHDVIDPANLFTLTANAGFVIGIDSHTAYGPGWKGFGRNIGYGLTQDATGEFISTFAIDSILHQDPHYHRSPQASIPRRFLHAISHTVISQHDDGTPMPNYSTLLTYPISAEISNLYVPGVAVNGPSTVKRVIIGYASNPIDDLITEFLPDLAKRVHVHAVFAQQILNNISSGQPM